jgi:hypothetical protein
VVDNSLLTTTFCSWPPTWSYVPFLGDIAAPDIRCSPPDLGQAVDRLNECRPDPMRSSAGFWMTSGLSIVRSCNVLRYSKTLFRCCVTPGSKARREGAARLISSGLPPGKRSERGSEWQNGNIEFIV